MAAVEDEGEVHPVRDALDGLCELVVGEGVIPVEVVGTDDLIEAVFELVAVAVANLGTVARVVEEQHGAGRRAIDQPVQALADVGGGSASVGEEADVLRIEAEMLGDGLAHQQDIVDAALEVIARVRVLVDAHEERSTDGLRAHKTVLPARRGARARRRGLGRCLRTESRARQEQRGVGGTIHQRHGELGGPPGSHERQMGDATSTSVCAR